MDNKIFEMETARIGLRKWQGTDAEALYRHASHPDVGPRAGWQPHSDVEESRTIISTVFNTPPHGQSCSKRPESRLER